VILCGLIAGAHLAYFLWNALEGRFLVGPAFVGLTALVACLLLSSLDEEGDEP
jgi:hypothetical protein